MPGKSWDLIWDITKPVQYQIIDDELLRFIYEEWRKKYDFAQERKDLQNAGQIYQWNWVSECWKQKFEKQLDTYYLANKNSMEPRII